MTEESKSAATTFRRDEVLLMDFIIKSILRGARPDPMLARKPAFARIAQKIQKMRDKVSNGSP